MDATNHAVARQAADRSFTRAVAGPPTALFAAAVAVIVTNLFAPQALVGPIAQSLGLEATGGALAVMATLAGYAAGLFLVVPLADLLENRALVVRMLGCAAFAATAAALAPTAVTL